MEPIDHRAMSERLRDRPAVRVGRWEAAEEPGSRHQPKTALTERVRIKDPRHVEKTCQQYRSRDRKHGPRVWRCNECPPVMPPQTGRLP